MVANEDIRKVIGVIEQKIQSLQGLKEQLLAEFGMSNGSSGAAQTQRTTQSQPQSPLFAGSAVAPPRTGTPTRKQQVMEILKQKGPLKRVEIVEQTGMPVGTVSFCLMDKKKFKSTGDGRWDLV